MTPLKRPPALARSAPMHPILRSSLDFMRERFGVCDRYDLAREHPGQGSGPATALVSLGWARPDRNDRERIALTDAGWRAAAAID